MSARIDLVTLSVFVAVIEETTLARAAERMYLAPSAISKRLADLEANLNLRLFDRKPTGMFPTAAGTALLNHARLILRNVAELETEMVDFASGLRGTIRLKANATAMTAYLPEDLPSFLALHPQVRIEIEEGTSADTLRAVSENVVDIGIYGDAFVPTELEVRVYRHDRLTLVIPSDHPLSGHTSVTLADIADYTFVGPQRGSSIDTALTRASIDLGRTLKMSTRVGGFEAITRFAEAGLGIAIVPESAARLYTGSLAVEALRLDEPWAERKLMLCTRNPSSLSPPAASFLEHLGRARPDGRRAERGRSGAMPNRFSSCKGARS